MINILFVLSDNSIYSGAFNSIVVLCHILKNNYGVNPVVVVPKKGNGVKLLERYGIDYCYVRSYSWVMQNQKKNSCKELSELFLKVILNKYSVARLCKIIRKQKIDIVHVNTIWSYVGAKAAKKMQVPCIWHIREALDADQNKKLYNNKCYDFIDSVDKIVVISDYLREHYSDRFSKDHMSVVYNGIDADRFICYRGEKREARGTIRFLNVASMIANKGQEVILKAVKILQNEGISDFMVSLVGGGSKEKDLIRYANDLGIIDKVLFCGRTDKVEEYYQNSDVFIMSSKAEAFGRVTVEAMMEGCCVIGSDSGATPELIEDGVTGLLYKCENVEDLARIMKGIILGDIDYKAIATQGQDYAIKNYSAAKNAESIYSIYQKIYNECK